MTGRDRSQVRGFLEAAARQPSLDRWHRRREQAGPDPASRAEWVRLGWLRRQRPRLGVTGVPGGSGHVAGLVPVVVCPKRRASGATAYRRVSRVLWEAVRASSVVEAMNRVWRMHQARHRGVTQGSLDLKRLSRDSRPFREAKRAGRCPCEPPGLKLPR